MQQRLYVLIGEKPAESESLEDMPPERVRHLVDVTYGEITDTVRLASFGGQERHVTFTARPAPAA